MFLSFFKAGCDSYSPSAGLKLKRSCPGTVTRPGDQSNSVSCQTRDNAGGATGLMAQPVRPITMAMAAIACEKYRPHSPVMQPPIRNRSRQSTRHWILAMVFLSNALRQSNTLDHDPVDPPWAPARITISATPSARFARAGLAQAHNHPPSLQLRPAPTFAPGRGRCAWSAIAIAIAAGRRCTQPA